MHSKAAIALQEMGKQSDVTVEMSTFMKLLLLSVGKVRTPATELHEFSPTERSYLLLLSLG